MLLVFFASVGSLYCLPLWQCKIRFFRRHRPSKSVFDRNYSVVSALLPKFDIEKGPAQWPALILPYIM